jgi:hypothetical protein
VTVTSAVGDIVFASIGSIPNVALTGTTIYRDTTHGAVINGGANYDVGAATVAIGVTSGAGNDSGIVAADIKAN